MKQWTQKEREKAAQQVFFQKFGCACDDPESIRRWACNSYSDFSRLIGRQCEINEVRELLENSAYNGSYTDQEAAEYTAKKREWLERNKENQ